MLRILPLLCFLLLVACNPTDRSGEQPLAPTVQSVSAIAEGDVALLVGQVVASPNSDLLACGFIYGNDTLRVDTAVVVPAMQFSVATLPLRPGRYYTVAYAKNGIGTAYGDTLRFTVGTPE